MKLPNFQKKPDSFLTNNTHNILILVGIFFVAIVLYLFSSQYLFMKKAQVVTGTVIRYEIPKNKSLRVPIIEYKSSDSKTHIYKHTEGTNPPTYRIGEQVKIYCNPIDNADIILGFTFIPMIILLIFGTLFSIVGFAMKH